MATSDPRAEIPELREKPTSQSFWRRPWWHWVAGGFAVLLLALVAVAVLFDWNWLRNPAQSFITAATGRQTVINGRLAGEWSLTPRFVIEDFHMANADWAREKELISFERAEVVVDLRELLSGRTVLREILLVKPQVALERRADGEGNWTFGVKAAKDIAAPEDRTEMPLIGRLRIQDGRFLYHDEKAGIDIDAQVATVVGANSEGRDRVRLGGRGTMHGEPFQLRMTGGSLLSLRENEEPYPLTIEMTVGATKGRISGTLADPIKFEGLDLEVALSGPDLGKLQIITGVPLPMTPPYDLKGRLHRDGAILRIENMAGRVGNSDLGGMVKVDTGRERLYIEADLRSKVLDYRDIGPLIGLRPEEERAPNTAAMTENQKAVAQKAAQVAAKGPPPKVLPDAPLAIEQIREVDAKVKFRGDKVEAPNTPLSAVELDLLLENSVLHLRPLKLGVAGGLVNADIRIDARTDAVLTQYDVKLNKFRLERFLESAGLKDSGSGEINGRIQLVGYGDTVQKSLGSANGQIRMAMDGGSLSNLAMELVGLDVAEAARFWAGGDKQIPLRCFVTDFNVEQGLMVPRVFVLDTSDTTVTAEGSISLTQELLGLKIKAHPKDPSLLSARTPINISGAFSRPSVGVDAAPLAARGAGAIALGVLLTPLASILAFIEPGLETDSDCAALLKQVQMGRPG
ncbi:AsmA family protein [Ferrovibrio terrae]|uniref:AsmA family protein n=1 Tax=Ferrovibrio terrae TaxID=2594003 RepID=A0A516H543_9PROT|nr:AsmA family protein [Ferrovibrio terrae]QDO98857.1 AsmA family protein [Ferrovibrio terrae]